MMNENPIINIDPYLKVIYKENIFNFGKDIKSYKQLIIATEQRFPYIKKYCFLFRDQKVTEFNFNTLMILHFVQNKKSIKLTLQTHFDQKDIQQETNQNQAIQNQKDQYIQANEKVIQPNQIKIKILIQNESHSIQTQIGTPYIWKCYILNQSPFKIHESIFFKDFSNQKQIQIPNLEINEIRQIIFGPFTENQPGKNCHFYQLLYKQKDQNHITIGDVFGFVSETKKKITVKQIQNKLSQRINQLKDFCICEKSTQYIVKRLKQLNTNEKKIDELKDQEIIDLIESLNTK